jgi:large subunit ribosomal protein L29
MARTKASELREMSEEQLLLTLKETSESLFRLRIQAATERLDAPSELRRHRRLIAQIKTVLAERQRQRALAETGPEAVATGKNKTKKTRRKHQASA